MVCARPTEGQRSKWWMSLRRGEEGRRGDAHWHSSRIASLPCFLPSGQHPASRRCYFPGPGVLSADNKQPDTRRPKLQRLAELEASRLSLRLSQTIGWIWDFAPSEGARCWCVCSDVNATELVERAGGVLQEGSKVLCRVASVGLNSRRQMLNAVSIPASYQISFFSPLGHFWGWASNRLLFHSFIAGCYSPCSGAHPALFEEIAALPAPVITPRPGLVPPPLAILLAAAALAVFQGGFEPAATSITSSPLGECMETVTCIPRAWRP